MTSARPPFWARPLEAARANLIPGLILQAFAVSVILLYYNHAGTHDALDAVAAFKERFGYLYSLLATILFGAAIPFLYMRLHPASRAHTPWSHLLFLTLFWGWKGVEVDFFYRFQGWFWGPGIDPLTITKKILLDLFLYCPLWATPTTILLLHWKETGFDTPALLRLPKRRFLRDNLFTALVATWSVWLPAVIAIYSLPSALQMPLFNIVLCFFSLLIITFTRRRT